MQRLPRWRLALVMLCLCTSSFQSVLSQAHLHVRRPSVAHVYESRSDAGAVEHLGSGAAAVCPLCQALLQGHAPPGRALIWRPGTPEVSAYLSIASIPSLFISAVSHNWRQRGPPAQRA
jgi:hypothetical protein